MTNGRWLILDKRYIWIRSSQPSLQNSKSSPAVSLIAGGVAGGVEAAATYPFEFAKTRVQLRSNDGASVPRNPLLVVSKVWRTEGLRTLYKGCSSLIVVGLYSDCILFSSFEQCRSSLA